MPKLVAPLTTAAWVASALPERRRALVALGDARRAQNELGDGLLRLHAESEYLRAHGVRAEEGWERARERLPPRRYDELAPWVDRVAAGEQGVLTGRGEAARVDRFEPSSGSAAAKKLIPSNPAGRAALARGVNAWIGSLYLAHPALMGGRAYWSISPAIPSSRTVGGLPVGFQEDSAYLGGLSAWLVDQAQVAPGALSRLQDPAAWRQATLHFLLAAEDLRLISVWSPSFLSLLLDALVVGWEEALRVLHDGAVVEGLRLPAAPRRARALGAVAPDDVARIWPSLGLLSCWADGEAAPGAKALQARLSGVLTQPKGLLATEGLVSWPLGVRHVAASRVCVIELLGDDGGLRALHELNEGDEGAVVITTAAGLWRYRLGDRVVVTGRVGQTPTLRFLGRADKVVDLRGEKLSDAFVASVLTRLCPEARFRLLAPEGDDPPRYTLFVESAVAPEAAALDAALSENPHYAWCRRLGQLGPAAVAPIGPGGPEAWLEAAQASGQRLGDVKPAALSAARDWRARLHMRQN
ncbi:GH3 auxin-responsive promoter family protein [Myxococcota bacterium]|nr:GH3 auxin-responsive promoter family protein [Myxococcota bacterium]